MVMSHKITNLDIITIIIIIIIAIIITIIIY